MQIGKYNWFGDHPFTDDFITKINESFSGVTLNPLTGILSFTKNSGQTFTVDFNIEDIIVSGRFDEETNNLVFTLVSGQEILVPLSNLINSLPVANNTTYGLVKLDFDETTNTLNIITE